MTVFPAQIAKLIPRLASEHDGEVVATARAIERILKAAGLDWHTLAREVDVPKPIYPAYGFSHSPSPPSPPRRQPDPPPPPRKPRERGWSDMARSEQTAWCEAMLRHPSLDSKTLSFVTDVLNKLHFGIMFDLNRRKKRLLTELIREIKEHGQAA